jgi:hypothetical protein
MSHECISKLFTFFKRKHISLKYLLEIMPNFFKFVERTPQEAEQVQRLQARIAEAKLVYKFTDTAW